MKYKYKLLTFALLSTIGVTGASAADLQYQIGGFQEWEQPQYAYFNKVEGGVEFAAAEDLKVVRVVESWGSEYRLTAPDVDNPYQPIYGVNQLTQTVADLLSSGTVEIDGVTYTIVGVGAYSFANNLADGVNNITLAESITTIGEGAFFSSYDGKIQSIDLGNATSIGDYAFINQPFASVTLPESLSAIGNGVFANCKKLSDIDLGAVTTMGVGAFENCTSLSSIKLPESLAVLSNSLFSGCNQLKTVNLDNITEIGDDVFNGCENLQEIDLTAVTKVGARAFKGCKNAVKGSVNLPNVTEIGDEAFAKCGEITDVTFGDNLTTIGAYAFQECQNLKSVNIPASVTSVGDGAFAGCSQISEVTIGNPNNFGQGVFTSSITTLNIPGPCETISKEFGSQFSQLTNLNIGEVKNISESAFEGASITNLNITGRVESIGARAFYGIINNQSLEIGDVDVIGESAFQNASLHTLKFTGNVYEIGDNAFENTVDLRVPLELPESLTKIGAGAFRASGITAVEIPHNVTSMGYEAFANCNGLLSIVIGNGLTEIGERQFYNCNAVKRIKISDSVKTIGKEAFANCSNMEDLDLGNGVEVIGEAAFEGCSTGFHFLRIPDSVKRIEARAFNRCSSLNGLIMSKNVEYIGDLAFYSCMIDQMDHLDFPACLEHIGYRAFSVTSNGSFTDLYCFASTPPESEFDENGYGCFGLKENPNDGKQPSGDQEYMAPDYVMFTQVCLHVPYDAVEVYKTHEYWGLFDCIIGDLANIEEAMDQIVGYEFMIPGEEMDIYDMLPGEEKAKLENRGIKKEQLSWLFDFQFNDRGATHDKDLPHGGDGSHEECVLSISNRNGSTYVTAHNFGQKIANCMIKKEGSDKGIEEVIGYVAIFVCPTVTVAYDLNDNLTASTPGNAPQSPDASEDDDFVVLGADGRIVPLEEDGETPQVVVEPLSTYQYRIVHNSYPRVSAKAAEGFEITSVKHGDADADGNSTGDMVDVVEDGNTDATEDYSKIVPMQPITNNRLVVFEAQKISAEDYVPTGSESIKDDVAAAISIAVSGKTLTVNGAMPESTVTVSDLNGRIVYNSREKTFTLGESGIYILSVEKSAFKLIVR